jgi:hypothetical protein
MSKEQWTVRVGTGQWTVDSGQKAVGSGQWVVAVGSGQQTEGSVHNGPCTVGIGKWAANSGL